MIEDKIDLNDQGIYYAINRKTGGINNVFQLVNEEDDWYLYQLKNVDGQGELAWVILAEPHDYPINPVPAELIDYYFAKPEYLEPKGRWVMLKNSKYGFGKFIPESREMGIHYGLMRFSAETMLVPILIEKAKDEVLNSLTELEK